jgi:hypothetical protein
MFRYKNGEKLCSHIARFLDVTNHLRKTDIILSEKEQIKKLLDSLPQEWSLQCMMIKRDILTTSSTLVDLIYTLKVIEIDLCKRGMPDLCLGSPTSTTGNATFAAPVFTETNKALGEFAGTIPTGSVLISLAPKFASPPSGSTT